jgi:hypothetical protein
MLSGTTTDAGITDKQTIQPFSTALITDLDEFGAQAQSVSVTFDATYGTISAPSMTKNGAGSYSITGTPAEVTAALNALVFTPTENIIDYITPGSFDLDFDLSIDDGYTGGLVQDTTTVTITPVNDAPTIASGFSDWELPVNSAPRARQLVPHFADVDDDVAAGQLLWTASSNNPSLFNSITVDPVKQLLVVDFAADQFGVAEILVRGTDRGGLFVETSFMVTIQGPHVIDLAEGETQPPAASSIAVSSYIDHDYGQSFRVINEGPLPADAFIVHLSDLNVPTIELTAAEYSTDENSTLTDFTDDSRSSLGVTILETSSAPSYSIKYDLALAAGESAVVHFTYNVDDESFVTIRPTVIIEWAQASTADAALQINAQQDAETGEYQLSFVTEAGRSYRLEYSSDLLTWYEWAEALPVSQFDTVVTVIDDGLNTASHPSEVSARFYRLVDITPEP